MPTADMHGGTVEASEEGIKFTDNKGNPVAFETCRLGTLKELETEKAALATANAEIATRGQGIASLHEKLAAMAEKRDVSEAAYKAEKEVSAELTKANQGIAEGIQRQKDTIADLTAELRDLKINLQTQRAATSEVASELANAKESLEQKNGALDQRTADVDSLITQRDVARAELENLLTVKASLEETSIALEVSQKELCEAREALADATKANQGYIDEHVAVTSELGTARGELNTSRKALADLKAELLTEGDRFKTILDTIAEKIAGE